MGNKTLANLSIQWVSPPDGGFGLGVWLCTTGTGHGGSAAAVLLRRFVCALSPCVLPFLRSASSIIVTSVLWGVSCVS